jgi:hypothetical protein
MRMKTTAAIAALVLAAASVMAVTPADAQWHHHFHGRHGHFHGGGGLAGFAAGAILGGVLAAQEPYYYGPVYGPPVYGPPVYDGNGVAYCESRFKSYDPASGTYLGYDGYRHSCP